MKRALILYNVKAGRAAIERSLARITAILTEGGYECESRLIRFGENPFDGCAAQPDLAVVCGGDGTINYIVNSMAAKGLNIPTGIIPAGTANDFAGALGISKNHARAARQIVEGTVESIDCGCVNGLRFINIFSFGLFTCTSQRTPDELKHRIGKLAYIFEGLKELRALKSLPLCIRHDAGEEHIDALMVLCFNGVTAGGFRLARKASLRDGVFELLVLRKRPLPVAAWYALRFLLTGRQSRGVHYIRSTRFEITSPLSPQTDVDGQRGAEFPLTVECRKGDLRIVCPKQK